MSSTQAVLENIFTAENLAGVVSQVSPAAVIFTSPPLKTADGTTPRLARTMAHEVGQYVIIDCGEIGVFGQLMEISASRIGGDGAADEMIPMSHVALLTSLTLADGSVVPGVLRSPQIGDSIYLARSPLIAYILESSAGARFGKTEDGKGPLLLSFARLPDQERTAVPFTPEQIFGSHCAVLGASGGGKSWTLARLLEECAQHRSKIVLLDPSGEFSTLAKKTRHIFIGTDPLPGEKALEVALPYFELTETDLFAIFKPEGQSQAPKLRAAMESLKLARLEPMLAPDGTVLKADRSKIEYFKAYRQYLREIEDPRADFDITKLPRQIVNECVQPNRSPVEPQYWGGMNGSDQAHCMPLVTRIDDMIKSKSLAPLFQPGERPSLYREIDEFLANDKTRVLRIAFQYLSTAYNAREIVANAVGRYLFQLARDGEFRKQPFLLVVDEAHRFLSERLNDLRLLFPLDAFGLIAKEGRKYSISICLSTQRPQDIPQDVLSQMGTMIIHRIISDEDLRVVERASGSLDRSSAQSLPRLVPGEAVIIGMSFPVPINISVEPPTHPPDSQGPNFQKYWR